MKKGGSTLLTPGFHRHGGMKPIMREEVVYETAGEPKPRQVRQNKQKWLEKRGGFSALEHC
jgi:hypothetical protein